MPASFETYPDVKTSAASLPCKSAISCSSSTMGRLVPEMLRVPPCPGPHAGRGFDHRCDCFGVLAHSEIIVGAPDQYFTRTVGRVPDGMRESPRQPFQFGKYPVAVLILDAGQCVAKKSVVFHFLNRIPSRVSRMAKCAVRASRR